MQLFPKSVAKTVPPLYSQEKKGDEAICYVKFFDPCSQWTWYATEFCPETRTFFGLVVGQETELGYFSLDELSSFKNRLGLGIERDLYWKPTSLRDIRNKVRS